MMPTTYRAEVNHQQFDWAKASAQIKAGLLLRRDEILGVIGFYDDYGGPDEWTEDERKLAESEAGEIMEEIASELASVAAIIVDAGFKPANRVLATVRVLARDPAALLRLRETMEPEALGSIARNYMRGAEPPGTHWQDITGDGNCEPAEERIKTAAVAAAIELSSQARKGGNRDLAITRLSEGLGGIFGRFQSGPITRAVATDTNSSGLAAGTEYGRYKDFLELVLPALENVLEQHGVSRRFSRDNLVRRTIEWQRGGL